MTGGDGIACLGVDTGWAASGSAAWLDVVIGGEYAGGGVYFCDPATGGKSCYDWPTLMTHRN